MYHACRLGLEGIVSKRCSDDVLPRPGFKSTAVYFEWLAQKETRDYDRRQRLLEVAGFYRSLAGIIPAMPPRCKINGAALPLTRAERWKARAEECRTLADCFTDPFCRGQLTRLAQSYDQMRAWSVMTHMREYMRRRRAAKGVYS